MKRWTEHPSMTKCSDNYRASVDLHSVSSNGRGRGGAFSAISFAVEASNNLAGDLKESPATAVRYAMNELVGWAKHEAEYVARQAGKSPGPRPYHMPKDLHGALKRLGQTKKNGRSNT